jgi:hypothetical protein
MDVRVLGVDLGRSGKTSFCILEGNNFHAHCPYLHAISSITAPAVENIVVDLHAQYNFNIICVETNGPGGTFVEYCYRDHPEIPIISINTSADPILFELWDGLELSEKDLLNIRAQMYWLTRLFFKDQRITLAQEDAELFAQLSTLRWDYDKNKNERIYMLSKRQFRYSRQSSEIDAEPFSRSPDKADSLALAIFAYCLCMQMLKDQALGEINDDIIFPRQDGFFDLNAMQVAEILVDD